MINNESSKQTTGQSKMLIIDKLSAALCVIDYPSFSQWCDKLEYTNDRDSYIKFSKGKARANQLLTIFTEAQIRELWAVCHEENI